MFVDELSESVDRWSAVRAGDAARTECIVALLVGPCTGEKTIEGSGRVEWTKDWAGKAPAWASCAS